MLAMFRTVSVLEGLSYLLILSVTLGVVSREYVFMLGMAHGALFLLYLVFSLLICGQKNWPLKVWLPLFFASVVPFAFLGVEWSLRRWQQNQVAVAT